jgi:hypothetical protein
MALWMTETSARAEDFPRRWLWRAFANREVMKSETPMYRRHSVSYVKALGQKSLIDRSTIELFQQQSAEHCYTRAVPTESPGEAREYYSPVSLLARSQGCVQ